MTPTPLPLRSSRILATVVREYIHTGEPVASVVIARRGTLGVSSATVRNVLARLEEQGFVRQPHTSAGRVPTDRGYRFYVDLLLENRRSADRPEVADAIREAANDEPSIEGVLSHVSHVLSTESHHIGFAVAPATDEQQRLRKIEFVSLEGARVLVVTLADGGQVTQKVVDAGEPLSPEELRRAAEYVNSQFAGLPIDEVQAEILARLHEARGLYDRLMTRAFDLARRALEHRARRNSIYVEGTASLLGDAQQSSEMSLQTLRTLVGMIEEKQRLVRLLEEYLHAPGLAVVIGAEHSLPDLKPFSLVAASYLDGRGGGSLGVIGPTRMRYSRAISLVESAARAVTDALDRN